MKKTLHFLTLCLVAFSFFGTLHAQTPIYQLPNGGFETWYRETSNANSIVPSGFHSFYSAIGSMATLGQAKRCDSSRDVRAGATGTFSLNLYSSTVLTVRANGNVTTGRMHANSMTANSADNYNSTDLPDYYQEITGTPDSLRFWVKYLPGRNGATNDQDKGRLRVYIHGTGECRDAPLYPSGMTETQLYYGRAMKEFYKEDGGWHSYQVPFVYTGTNSARNADGNYYVLVSMTTNATPGGGANNPDKVWFDDIEFIYSAWLNDLKVNNTTIAGFQKGILNYNVILTGGQLGSFAFPYQPGNFSWTTEVADATVTVTNHNGPYGDAHQGYTSVLVTAEDGVTTKEYKIHYAANLSNDNTIASMSYTLDGTTPVSIPGFTPAQTNYNVEISNPEETRTPQILASSIALSHNGATVQSIEQPTGINSRGTVVVKAENWDEKSYNLFFSKVQSSNSKLSWIKVGGVDIPNFDANVLEYNYVITACESVIPAVTYEKASVWANVNYTPATLTNRTATITVTAENGAQTIYAVHFDFKSNDVSFQHFRFGTSTNTANEITSVVGQTVYERAFSFTSAQTLFLNLTCPAASFTKTPATTVYYPDTNYFYVTAQDGVTKATYKVVVKNRNCFLATGNNNALRYNYNGLTNQNTAINITTANNDNLNTVITSAVTLPAGANVAPELVVYGTAATAAAPTWQITQPTHRNDTATVILTANDGVTQKMYKVPFKETLSADASLIDIKCNGVSIDAFSPATTSYTVFLPANITTVPEITGIPNFQWLPAANIVVTPATDLLGNTTIHVTAENGTTTRTYTINFDTEPVDNAYLSALYYDGNLITGFNPTTFIYTQEIPFSTTCPTLYGVPKAAGASVFYSGSNTLPCVGKALVFSENLQGMKIYTVNFIMVKNTNPALADIKINGVSLEDFNSGQFEYDYELPYTEFTAPVVTATPAYPAATVQISQINTVTGTVTINVTAEDDVHTATYTIDFTRALSPVNTIEEISYIYNGQTSHYTFNENETEVTFMLPAETTAIPSITNIVLTDNRSEPEIVAQPNATNNLTGIIVVTAEDLTEKTYTIHFQRILSESTLITGITYNGIPVPNFDPAVLTYNIILPYSNSQNQVVAATAAWINTAITYSQPTNPFGQATILVTSEDGQHFKTYTINFQRKGNCQLNSLVYTLNGVTTPVSNFNPSVLNYTVSLDYATTATPVLVYVPEDNRCSTYENFQNTPNGTSSVKLVTWNGDDSLTYTVTFTVLVSTEAVLSNLKVDGVTVAGFNANQLHYTYPQYEYGTEPHYPVVTATAQYPDAHVNIVQINNYPGVATVTVTAGNPTITRTYTVSFSVEAGDNNHLQDLLISNVHWWQFNRNVYFYTDTLPHGTTVLPTIDGIAEDDRASVEKYQAQHFGDTAKIVVTALNGDIATYYVYFVERGKSNAFASMIYVDWKPLPDFDKYVRNYTYTLPAGYTGEPYISAELEDPDADWHRADLSVYPLKTQIICTAEDGITTMVYTISFTIENSIRSFDNETDIHVYPNPASDYIHFNVNEMDKISTLEIYTMEGKRLDSHTLKSGINTVNIASFAKGIYFYKIISNNALLGAGKFVKN